MSAPVTFSIEKKLKGTLGRAGIIHTPHGPIHTPTLTVVGTKGTVKSLTPEEMHRYVSNEAVLANTYHLYLQPGHDVVREAGGLHAFMHWDGPMLTDSGGFQVFSLGAAFGKGISKFIKHTPKADQEHTELNVYSKEHAQTQGKLCAVDEEGVTFTSHMDGSLHRFTPERSIEIQHALGADIMFAFDECTSPTADYSYQKEALDRTHRWAKRSLLMHKQLITDEMKQESFKHHTPTPVLPSLRSVAVNTSHSERQTRGGNYRTGDTGTRRKRAKQVWGQGLFGIVQGGLEEDLREKSARELAGMEFDGYGIGGCFSKEDLTSSIERVNTILPEEKPRHLLGIGEPEDLFRGVETGCDTFDCVAPTRIARTGQLYTHTGKINLANHAFRRDFGKPDEHCDCYVCEHYTRAYLAHLFRAGEMLGAHLASIHNLYFIVDILKNIRQSILDDQYQTQKEVFLSLYTRK